MFLKTDKRKCIQQHSQTTLGFCVLLITASCEPIGASNGATVDEHIQLAAVIPTGRGCSLPRDGSLATISC